MIATKQFSFEYECICRKHGLFTCGGLEQYGYVMGLYRLSKEEFEETGRTSLFFTLVYATWLCSDKDKFIITDIERIFRPYFEKEDAQ